MIIHNVDACVKWGTSWQMLEFHNKSQNRKYAHTHLLPTFKLSTPAQKSDSLVLIKCNLWIYSRTYHINTTQPHGTTATVKKYLKSSNVNVNTPRLVLHRSCVPVKVDINQKGVNEKWYSYQKSEVSTLESCQPQGVTPKITWNVINL